MPLTLSYSEFTDSKMPSCQGSTAGSSCEVPERDEKWQNSFSVDVVMHLGKKMKIREASLLSQAAKLCLLSLCLERVTWNY